MTQHSAKADAPPSGGATRKRDSRQRMLAAAAAEFLQRGYMAVSVEDIAKRAGVSRMTLYRHFSGKTALAIDLFRQEVSKSKPRCLQICSEDFRDRQRVKAWLEQLFEADKENRGLLRVFSQITAEDESFTQNAQLLIAEMITDLGEAIPAFQVTPDNPKQRRRWLEAWLLIYEILDQSNHAALNSGIAGDPIVIDILTDRFLAFVLAGDKAK